MRKYLQSIVPAFINGSTSSVEKTCHVRGNVFFSYSTPIAVRVLENGITKILLSEQKFSKTTSTQQNAIRAMSPHVEEVAQSVIDNLSK